MFKWHSFDIWIWVAQFCLMKELLPSPQVWSHRSISTNKQTNIIISDYQHENVCGAPCQLMLGLLMFNRNIFYYGDVAECGRVSVTPLQGSPHHYTPLPQSDGCEYFCKLLIWNNADTPARLWQSKTELESICGEDALERYMSAWFVITGCARDLHHLTSCRVHSYFHLTYLIISPTFYT